MASPSAGLYYCQKEIKEQRNQGAKKLIGSAGGCEQGIKGFELVGFVRSKNEKHFKKCHL